MAEDYRIEAYLADFRCLGADCEDTCCHHWDVGVDMVRYESLAAVMAADPDERRLFQASVRPAAEPTARRYATIQMQADGHCPFHEESGWCRIHRRHGEGALAETCALFPRVLSRSRDTVEVTGALSCPEVARRSLLDREGASTSGWQAADSGTLPVGPGHTVSRSLGPSHYEQHMPRLREEWLDLIPRDGTGFEVGLLAAAYLAARIAPFYHAGCRDPEPELSRALMRWQHPDLRPTLARRLARQGNETDESTAVIIIQALLGLRINRFGNEPLSRDAAMVFEDLEAAGVAVGEAGFVPTALATAYRGRRARVLAGLGLHIERALARWMHNTLRREWYTTMPDPFVYLQMLLIRMAALRFLLYCDPAMLAVARARDRDAADALIVRWAYRFARSVDHNLSFLEAIYHAACEQGLMNLEATPNLIRP